MKDCVFDGCEDKTNVGRVRRLRETCGYRKPSLDINRRQDVDRTKGLTEDINSSALG